MIKYAIFDADGTLFDSMHIWKNFANRYLKTLGVISNDNLDKELEGISLRESAEYLKNKYNLDMSVDEVCDGITNNLKKYYLNEAIIKPGVSIFLKKLKDLGVKMCIATSSQKTLIESALKINNISEYFDFIITSNDVGVGKSKPDIFLRAANMLGGEASLTVVFEDTAHAAVTAKNAGFIVCGIQDDHEKNFPVDFVDYYINCLTNEMDRFFEKYF